MARGRGMGRWLAGRVPDDAGRSVRLWFVPARERAFRRALQHDERLRGWMWRAALVSLPWFALPAIAIPWMSARGFGWAPILLVSVLLGGVGPLAYARCLFSAGGSELAGAIVRHGRCASCGYDIAAVPEDGQGLRVCPECGAAWRAPATLDA